MLVAWADPEGEKGSEPLENHKWLYVSLEILVHIPSRSNWTHRFQLLHASRLLERRSKCHLKWAIIGPPAKRH